MHSLGRAYPGQLFTPEHGRQMPKLGFHSGGIDHSIRDFLAKEFAIPLAKPVNGDLERSQGDLFLVF